MTKEDRINLIAGGLIGAAIAAPLVMSYCLSNDFQRASMLQGANNFLQQIEQAELRAAQPLSVTWMQFLTDQLAPGVQAA